MTTKWSSFKARSPKAAAYLIKLIEKLIETSDPLSALRLAEFGKLKKFLGTRPESDLVLLGITAPQIGYDPALLAWANVFGAERLQEYVRTGKC